MTVLARHRNASWVHRVGVAVACTFTGVLLLACSSRDEEVPQLRSRYIRWYSADGDEALCAGSFQHYDDFIERALQFFDLELDADYALEVTFVASDHEWSRSTPAYAESAPGYTRSDGHRSRVFIRTAGSLQHEIVHAIMFDFFGQMPALIEEGTAEALTGELWSAAPVADDVTGLAAAPPASIDYPTAARFVHHVHERFGHERFLDFLDAASSYPPEDEAAAKAAYLTGFGVTFADIVADYAAAPASCVFLFDACGDQARHIIGGGEAAAGLYLRRTSTCASASAVGLQGVEHWESLQDPVDFQVVEAGPYAVVVGTYAWLMRCGSCAEQLALERIVFESPPLPRVVVLQPGNYRLQIEPFVEATYDVMVQKVEP